MILAAKTDWTGVPREDRYAKPARWLNVESRRVVVVRRGSIRKAQLRNAAFLLTDESRWLGLYRDRYRVTVQCMWFGCKPAGSWMHILVEGGDYEMVENYSGQVVIDLARKPAPTRSFDVPLVLEPSMGMAA